MEAIIFSGIQAAGKSSFFYERFFHTHVRISLDMLRTRHREALLLRACIEMKQPFVVDNTNPAREDRARYIEPAKKAGFRIAGYFFETCLEDALLRNSQREGRARIPERGLLGTSSRLEPQKREEGFDAMFRVRLVEGVGFEVRPVESRTSGEGPAPE